MIFGGPLCPISKKHSISYLKLSKNHEGRVVSRNWGISL